MKGGVEDECQDNAAATVLLFPLKGRHQAGVVVQSQVVLVPHLKEGEAHAFHRLRVHY